MPDPAYRARRPIVPSITAALVAAVVLVALAQVRAQQNGRDHWVATWGVSVIGRPAVSPEPPRPPRPGAPPSTAFMHFNNQTLREIVRVSLGGSRVRVALSNAFGTAPLTIGAAHLAIRATEGTTVPGSDRVLTFSGRPTFTIPAGAEFYSDPVDLAVAPMADLAIDLYLPGSTNVASPLTMRFGALQTHYVSETGNFAGQPTLPVIATIQSWIVVSRIEVAAPPQVGAVVAFGDSITEGFGSTANSNNRWPNLLAKRLVAASTPRAVVNAGIGGNRILSEGAFQQGINAVARFDRDVLPVAGVTDVIVMQGINDIGNAGDSPIPTTADLAAGLQQIVARARTHGLRVYGATLTPFVGAPYYTQTGERKRLALNQWIRTSGAFDGVVDFDAALRDPNRPDAVLPRYDSGDHLHPNDAGYKAMADAIDVSWFTTPPAMPR
ncbi:MAG: SGNH/GDSL hydrolase family protein [Acidobacteriota bacterium]